MADGTVRGAFELDADQPITDLGKIRDTGAEADTALANLGRTMDDLGGVGSSGKLDDYKSSLSSVGSAAEDTAAKVSASWDTQAKAIDTQATKIKATIDDLNLKLDDYSQRKATASVSLSGFDEVNAQLQEIEDRLDALGKRSATARVGVSGGAGGAGGGAAGSVARDAESAGGGASGGFSIPEGWLGKLAIGALAASPGIVGLAGSATALAGSATSAALGAGVAGLGAYGALGAGGLLSAATLVPAIKNLASLAEAQSKYNAAVADYGRKSSEATTAAKALRGALAGATPQEAGAARQYGLLTSDWTRDTRGARNDIYQGASNVLYNARRATPAVARDATVATNATTNAAVSFSRYLTDPQSLSTLRSLTASFAVNMPIAEKSLQNITTTFGHLAVDAQPFFTEADQWVEHWTAGVAKSSGDTQRVQGDMTKMVDSAKDWAHLTGAVYDTVKDIFSAGTPSGNSMVVDLTNTFDKWNTWIQDNPQKVSTFFTQAATTTDHIANVVSGLVSDIFKLANELDPIFNRAMQLIQFATGVGGGNGLLGGGLLLGAFEGGKAGLSSLTGRESSVSGGRAAAAFVTGRGGFLRGGNSTAGGTVMSAAAGRSGSSTRSFLAPVSRPRPRIGEAPMDERSQLLAGGAFGARETVKIPEEEGSYRRTTATPERFEERYGGVEGAHYAAPVSEAGEVPFRERTGAISAGTGVAMDAMGAAAKFLAPMLLIQGLLGAVDTKGGALSKLGGGVNAASFGVVPSNLFSRAFGTSNTAGGSNSYAAGRAQLLGNAADAVRTPGQLRSLQSGVQGEELYVRSELAPGDAQKLVADLNKISQVAATNAGAAASNTWSSSFSDAITRGVKPQKAVGTMLAGMDKQLKDLGPQGSLAFANSTAAWAKQMEEANPSLRAPLQKLMDGITGDLDKLSKTTGSTMSGIQRNVGYYNGQIYTSTKSEWAAISTNLTNPLDVAQEKLAGSFASIQKEAISSLTSMGFSRSQATSIVTNINKGGQAGGIARNTAALTGGNASGTIATSSGSTLNIPTAAAGHARGGVLGGSGLLDTVGMPDGSMAAPGEAWIANRHTMNDLSSATLAHYGKTAWQMIRDETRTHSSPGRRYALGGAVGGGNSTGGSHYERLLTAANRVSSANFPYQWGGGHEQPAQFQPFDCSGTVSYVTQQAGYNVPTTTAGNIGSWGFPEGPGTVTIYSSPVHTFMKIGAAGPKGIGYFGTSGFARPGGGAGWFDQSPGDAYLAGFRKFHLPDLGSSGGMAGGGGGMGSINLRAPAMNGLGGVPLALAQRGSSLFAAGLSSKLNANARVQAMGGGGGGDALNDVTGGASAQAAERLGRSMMLNAGWGASQWPSLDALWSQESGWNPNAVNPSSGAYGIPQALGHGHPYSLGAAGPQIAWGLNYIKGRYGSPAAAEAHEKSAGWYQRGGGPIKWGGWHARGMDGITNGPTLFGAGEGGRAERVTVTPVTRGGSGNKTSSITVDMRGSRFYGTSRHDAEGLAEEVAGKILDALNRVGQGASDAQLMGADA